MTKPHTCTISKTCSCSIIALEPDEECPVHGWGPDHPSCGVCGRFVAKQNLEEQEPEQNPDKSA